MQACPPTDRQTGHEAGRTVDHSAHPLIVIAGATFLLTAGDVGQKILAVNLSVPEVVFIRFAMGAVLATAILLWAEARFPSVRSIVANVPRLMFNGFAAMAFLYAVADIPLAVAVTVFHSSPFYIVLFGWLLLGERITLRIGISMTIGFVGVVVAVSDQFSPGAQIGELALSAALAAAPANAMAVVLLRMRTVHETTKQLVFLQNAVSAALFAPLAFLNWRTPHATELAGSALIACIAVAGHLMLVYAFSRAHAARLSIIEYSGLVWAALFGYVLFNEPLTLNVVAGACIIGVSGFVLMRERRPAA